MEECWKCLSSSAVRHAEAGGRTGREGGPLPEARARTGERGSEGGLHYSRLRHLAFVRLAFCSLAGQSSFIPFATRLDLSHSAS